MEKIDILLKGLEILKSYKIKPEISQDTLYIDFLNEKDFYTVSQKDITELVSMGWKSSVTLGCFSLRLKDIK